MDFQKTIQAKASKEKVYQAVTQEINQWWGNVDTNDITKVGDEFSIYFEENTEWRFTVTELERDSSVRWKCIHAYHSYGGVKGITKEWLNSEVIFKFKDLEKGQVELFFEHRGLTPDLNCYEMCDAGWTYFVGSSLKQYLETGEGGPNLVEPH